MGLLRGSTTGRVGFRRRIGRCMVPSLVVAAIVLHVDPVVAQAAPVDCASPPAAGTPIAGFNVIVAQPGTITSGTAGPDLIYGTSGLDRIAGLGGDDVIIGFGGDDQLYGGDGNDTL